MEVDLCGHATVASAHVLWQDGHLPEGKQARFHTRSGLLTADRRGDWIELDFPAKLAVAAKPPAELLPALGVAQAKFVGKNAFDYLVEVDSEETLRALSPDHGTLRKIPVRGVIVTARASTAGFDFVSRFFAPGLGDRRRPGDRVGAHGTGAVLGEAPGKNGVHGVPGIGARRRGASAAGRATG